MSSTGASTRSGSRISRNNRNKMMVSVVGTVELAVAVRGTGGGVGPATVATVGEAAVELTVEFCFSTMTQSSRSVFGLREQST